MNETGQCVHDLGDDPTFTEEDFREMVQRLAHEVRNPLASIKSSAQLMRRLQMAPSTALPYLESVVSEVSRIDTTIKKLELFASLQAGTVRTVELGNVVNRALAFVNTDAAAAGVQIRLVSEMPAQVAIDSHLVEVALRELLLNAIQFSSDGGDVLVSMERLEQIVAVHVDNRGDHIPDQLAPQIRRPFYSTLTQGVGLGLNVVQRACRLLGCHAQWQNLREGGCRFSLMIPAV
jgi:signal transduction histidine kinase